MKSTAFLSIGVATIATAAVLSTSMWGEGQSSIKETSEDGLGPTYNTQSCSACHQNIVTGAASQIAEHRTGHTFNGQFFESPGGSLIQSRATFPEIVEHVLPADEVRTFRMSTSTVGDGYVECVSDSTLP